MVTLFKEGMRVRFYPSHDGAHQLTGTIEKIHDNAPMADVMAEPDGKFVEVARLFTSNLSDLVPAEPEPNGEND